MGDKQSDREAEPSVAAHEGCCPAELLDYIAEMTVELRSLALRAGCVTLGSLLEVASQEARLQIVQRHVAEALDD